AMALTLTRLPDRPPDWDTLIPRYPGKSLFHESGWLDHIATIYPGSALEYLSVHDGCRPVGYLSVHTMRRFFLKILGSPLPGTGTLEMGPLIEPSVDIGDVIVALSEYCKATGVKHMELAGYDLEPERARALGLQTSKWLTRLRPLPSNESDAWAAIRSTCRNRIRKALHNGLVAEWTDDPRIIDHFYEQYQEVWAKQGLTIPFGIERVHSLWENLLPKGLLIPVWVKHGDQIVATGLFPHDEKCVYFWGGASWLRYHHLYPNELLHWTLMRLAIERGIPLYDMYGGKSQFKAKFGGEEVIAPRYSMSFLPLLKIARNQYRAYHR